MGRGWGALMRRRVRRLAGQCLLVKCPDTSLRSCRRKRNGKGGTCRIWPECRCIRAAGGIKICLVRQILPSILLPLSSTASNACFMDFSPADIPPPRTVPALSFAVASNRQLRANPRGLVRELRICAGILRYELTIDTFFLIFR